MLWARPMPDSSMPPHHTGMAFLRQRSWMRRACRWSADASEFDVDDLAGAESDGGLGLLVGVNALVEADGRLQSFLDLHVAEQVVPAQRLLDHHQVVGVHLLEQVEIFQAIGGVGVNGKLDVRKFLADAGDLAAGPCPA